MSISKYVSDVKRIEAKQENVYNYLSNFENLSAYINNGLLEKISEQVPQVKVTNFETDKDSCRFTISPMGSGEISIVNRQPHSEIKAQSTGSLPLNFTFWIQLLPINQEATKIRLTLHAELNNMIKMMIGNKLKDGINQLASKLAGLNYPDI